jgi:predicted SAM-dependent methyltransferase
MVLEHIQVSEIKSVLDQWKRVLKKGGVLRLTVPNFDSIIQVYKDNKNDVNAIANPLMGGQGYKYNFHYSIFNKVYLRNLLKKSGFRDVKTWDPKNAKYYDFNDWASRNYKINGKEYNISLNLEAIK